MVMNSPNEKDERVEKIFRELQEKGLIDRKIKLEAMEKIGNFKSSVGRKRILYNPKFSAYLNEDAIKFALLHEMGHRKVKYKREAWFMGLSFILMASWGICFLIFTLNIAYTLIVPINLVIFLVLFFLSFYGAEYLLYVTALYLRPWMSKDEFAADEWAATQLKRVYKINNPSEILQQFFNSAKKYMDDRKKIEYCSFIKCFGLARCLLTDPHPSDVERVENIKKKVDGGARNA